MEADLIVTARYILTMETQIPLIDHALVIFQVFLRFSVCAP